MDVIVTNHKDGSAKAVCGLEDTRSTTSHWMGGHEDQAAEFKKRIQSAAEKCNAATNEDERVNAKEKLKRTPPGTQKETRMLGNAPG